MIPETPAFRRETRNWFGLEVAVSALPGSVPSAGLTGTIVSSTNTVSIPSHVGNTVSRSERTMCGSRGSHRGPKNYGKNHLHYPRAMKPKQQSDSPTEFDLVRDCAPTRLETTRHACMAYMHFSSLFSISNTARVGHLFRQEPASRTPYYRE